MDHRIQDAETKAADPEEESPETYIGLLKTLHRSKKEAVRRLEELKADAASCKAANLGEVQSLLGLLECHGDELKEVRRKLKSRIRAVVSEIWVHITRVSHMQRVAQVQIHLRSGTVKRIVARTVARFYFDGMSTTATDPAPLPPCPRCSGTHIVRNGVNASGTPVLRCQTCRRRFVAAPKKGPVGEPDRALVRRLLAERVGVRAIARITGRSRSWVQGFVNALYREDTPHDPGPPPERPAGS